MKVKIGDIIYDANDEPIMLIFEGEKEQKTFSQQIFNMFSSCTKYCIHPADITNEQLVEFMQTD